ncbi:MAG: heavy-metal-associated domain-containing protein [Sphingobacteriales bacterium]|nr:heavy-metal-associated domain-containing protein [Sphingobacteriales bacterium]
MKSLKTLFIVLSMLIAAPIIANTTLNLTVKGMHCGGCETKFKTVASGIDGIKEVTSVSAANSNAVIVYDEKTTSSDKIVKSLAEQTGYTVSASAGAAVTTATGKPAGCCMAGQSNPSCKDKDKAKCAKTKCDKPEK